MNDIDPAIIGGIIATVLTLGFLAAFELRFQFKLRKLSRGWIPQGPEHPNCRCSVKPVSEDKEPVVLYHTYLGLPVTESPPPPPMKIPTKDDRFKDRQALAAAMPLISAALEYEHNSEPEKEDRLFRACEEYRAWKRKQRR